MSSQNEQRWATRFAAVLRSLKRTGVGLCVAAAGTVALTGAQASAQAFPDQPVKLIVPFTAGGATDVAARLLAEKLTPMLGQPVVVENRPGASASVAATSVARAAPNGYNILVGSSTLASNAVVPGSTMNFDLLKDFEFIGEIARSDLIVVTSSKTGVTNLRGLLDLMRTQRDKVQFGSAGVGSSGHLGGELLKHKTGTSALHIPYRGESVAVADLIGGQTTFQLCTPSSCARLVQEGVLRAVAVTAKKRSSLLPNVPTMAEAGLPGVEAGPWWFLAAPKGTPGPIVDKLNASLNAVLADPRYRTRLQELGMEVEPQTTPAAVRTELQAEMDKWRPVVKAAGITNN